MQNNPMNLTDSIQSLVQAWLDKEASAPNDANPNPTPAAPAPTEPATPAPADPAKPVEGEPAKDPAAPTDGEPAKEQTPEEKYNLRAVPYERFKDINDKRKTAEEEVVRLNAELKKYKETPLTDEEIAKKEEYRKMWIPMKEDQIQTEIDSKKQEMNALTQKQFEETVTTLEKTYDGANWLPKFEQKEVLQFSLDNEIYNPEAAYIFMNLPKIINHFVQKEVGKFKNAPATPSTPTPGSPDEWKKVDLKSLKEEDGSMFSYIQNAVKWVMS